MCLIAYRRVHPGKRGSNIPESVIETALKRHPDGFGVSWREGGKLLHAKYAPAHAQDFRTHLRTLDKHAGIEYVAHFRFATHGPKDAEHAHPYIYTDPEEGEVLVFHNGTIDIRTTPQESDTEVFVRDVLAHLRSGWWRDPALRYLVSASVGWSRLVVMTATETVNLQESSGEWDGGIWYSSNHRPTVAWQGSKYAQYAPANNKPWVPDGKVTLPKPDNVRLLGTGTQRTSRKQRKHKAQVRDVDRMPVYQHAGHLLKVLKPFSRSQDGDYEDAVLCETCLTSGHVYVIDHSLFIDIDHKEDLLFDGEEESDLLASLMRANG